MDISTATIQLYDGSRVELSTEEKTGSGFQRGWKRAARGLGTLHMRKASVIGWHTFTQRPLPPTFTATSIHEILKGNPSAVADAIRAAHWKLRARIGRIEQQLAAENAKLVELQSQCSHPHEHGQPDNLNDRVCEDCGKHWSLSPPGSSI